MKLLSLFLTLLTFVPISGTAQERASKDLVLFSLLRTAISFDGGHNEAGWERLQKATGFINLETRNAAIHSTDCRSAYDEVAVYFLLEMGSAHSSGPDAVEIWLSAGGNLFHQFIIDQNGDLKIYRRNPAGVHSVELPCEAKVSRGKNGWKAQIRIPFAALRAEFPKDNTRWKFNLARHWQGKRAPELSSWSPVKAFDQPRSFGELAFYSKSEIPADIAYWENNDNDPLLRRAIVSGIASRERNTANAPAASLWNYDPFSVDRAVAERWQCKGLTSERFASNRGLSLSAEKDYPAYFQTADTINRLLLKLSETRLALDELDRAIHYAAALLPVNRKAASAMEKLNRRYSESEETLDRAFAAYTAAFLTGPIPEAARLAGLAPSLTSLREALTALDADTAKALHALQAQARKQADWQPADTTLDPADERRDAQGAPRRFWFSAYGLNGTEPYAGYFGPFRSWNIDWPYLIADRNAEGTFSMPFYDKALSRLSSPESKINFHTGIGLVSYQMPTSAWLESRIATDPDILAQAQDQLPIPKTKIGALDAAMRRGVNIESPITQDYAKDYLSYVIGQANADNRVDFVVSGWEDRTELRIWKEGKVLTRTRGYDPISRKAFQDYLKATYETIGQLNTRWQGADYNDFSDIAPPDDPYLHANPKATALSYEWGRWQNESHFVWGRKLREAIKARHPRLPVMTDSSHLLLEGAGLAAMNGGSADIISFHYNPAHEEAMFAYLESLSRRMNLPLACFENYCLMYSRLEGDDERLGARAMRRNFADLIARDVRILSFWLSYRAGATPYIVAYGGANYRIDTDQTLLRWPTTEVALFKKQVSRLERLLVESAPAAGKIAVILPDSSFIQTRHLQGERRKETAMAPFVKFQNLIFSERSLPVEYLHEDELAKGSVSLASFDAVLIQDAPFLQSSVLKQLNHWAKQSGKHLFVAGPLGFFNQFGQPLPPDESPLRVAFPELALTPNQPWKLKPRTDWLSTVSYGEGRITHIARSLDEFQAEPVQLRKLQASLEPYRRAAASHGQIRVQLRQNATGETFLLLSNRDLRAAHSFNITLNGAFPKVFDTAIAGWFPVPSTVQNQTTTLRCHLAPGDWTLLQLHHAP